MSSPHTIPVTAPQPRSAVSAALVAFGAVVAIAVATLLILTLSGSRTTNSLGAAAHTQTAYTPLIQYRGTGEAPAARVSSGAAPTTGLLRAEHSYGATP